MTAELQRRFEATDATFWFGSQDDLAIRVRRKGNESVADLRSASRVGLWDLGTNAGRIRSFIERWGQRWGRSD